MLEEPIHRLEQRNGKRFMHTTESGAAVTIVAPVGGILSLGPLPPDSTVTDCLDDEDVDFDDCDCKLVVVRNKSKLRFKLAPGSVVLERGVTFIDL